MVREALEQIAQRCGQLQVIRFRLALVGDAADYSVPQKARVINAEGKFIIPGLIDAHVHLHFLSTAAGVPDTDLLPKYLAAGVTSVPIQLPMMVSATPPGFPSTQREYTSAAPTRTNAWRSG